MGQLFNLLTDRRSMHQIGGMWCYLRQVYWSFRFHFRKLR